MKIRAVHIGGFGRWSEKSFDFDEGFNLVFGPNEAGKSTLLQFIQYIFYGLGDLRGKSLSEKPRELFYPWGGEHYGGSIRFSLMGREYKLDRSFGKTKNFDKIHLLDATTGEALPLQAGLEPGEQLLKMSLSEFRNSVFTGQNAAAVANESDMKRRLSATMTGSDALVSTDEMLKKLEEMQRSLSSNQRQESILKRLQNAEAQLLEEQAKALANDRQIVDLLERIEENEKNKSALIEEKEEQLLKVEVAQRSSEISGLREGIALAEKQAALQADLAVLSEELGLTDQSFSEAGVDLIQSQLNEWAKNDNTIQSINKLQSDYHEKQLQLEDGGKTRRRLSVLQEALTKKEKLNREWQALKEQKAAESLAFNEEKNTLSQENSERKLQLEKLRAVHKAELDTLEDAYQQKQDRTALQSQLDKTAEKQEAARMRLQLARENMAAVIQEKATYEKEEGKLQESNRRLAQWENAWDENAKRGKFLMLGFAVAVILAIVGLVALLFKAEIWPWIVLLSSILIFLFSIWYKSKLAFERKDYEHDREQLRKNNERLLHLNSLLADQEKQLQWAQSQETQSLNDVREFGDLEAQVKERLLQLQSQFDWQVDEQALLSEKRSLFNEKEAELEKAIAEAEQILENKVYRVSDMLDLSEKRLDLAEQVLAQELQADGVDQVDDLSAALDREKEKIAQLGQIGQSLETLNEQLQAADLNIEQVKIEIKELSGDRVRSVDFQEAQEDFLALKQVFEEYRQKLQSLERLNDQIRFKLGERSQAEAVLQLYLAQDWLKARGAVEKTLTDKERSELEVAIIERDEQIQKINENLWRNREQVKSLQSLTRLPAQIEHELERNQAAMKEVLAESRSLELAQTWIREADREQRLSFGPAINDKFGKMLSALNGEAQTKLLLSNDFEIKVEDPQSGIAREREYYSAGKMDQLYLALRLAIIESVYMQEDKLPLIFDDSFVQFDGARTQNALDFLMQLAGEEGLQIIFSTCHQAILDYVKAKNQAKVLELGA